MKLEQTNLFFFLNEVVRQKGNKIVTLKLLLASIRNNLTLPSLQNTFDDQ